VDSEKLFWAETRFVASAPHPGFDRKNWKATRAGRTIRVSVPTTRDLVVQYVQTLASEKGCDCEMFWVMHPLDARSHEIFAPVTYVCQAQIESD
jgi:hypothetical protein